MTQSPLPYLPDHVHWTRDAAAGEPADLLIEGDVDGVEKRGDLVEAAVVRGRALPEPRSIQVNGGSAIPSPCHLLLQLFPGRELTTQVNLG